MENTTIKTDYIINDENDHEDKIPKFAPMFSLNGLKTRAHVCDIYDGDTIKVIFKFNGVYNKWNCRILGIDTPELRGGTDEDKIKAKASRDYLKTLILGKNVTICCEDFDNFGRLLIDVYYDTNVTKIMIEKGYGEIY